MGPIGLMGLIGLISLIGGNSPYRAYRAYKPYKANRPSKPNNQLFLPQILYPRKGATLIKIVKVVHVLVSLTLKDRFI